MENLPILIAGGGIAGIAAALGLARRGHETCVLEQAPVFETAGAGLQIGPNAVKALQWLGAWDALEPRCVAPGSIEIKDGTTGATLREIGLGKAFEDRFGAPYRVAHRADLLDALVAAAREKPAIELRTGQRVTGYRNASTTVEAILDNGDGLTGSHLIGADGIHSAVRAQLLKDGNPTYRGQALFRALVPIGRVPAAAARNTVCLWLAPGCHAVHYPVSAGEEINLVVSVDSAWTSGQWSEPAAPHDLAAVIARVCPTLAEIISSPGEWLKWAGADRKPATTWHDSRVVMLGDAAHATLPYLAQGAAMALEDAVTLAQTWNDFGRYMKLRRDRTMRIQAQSRRMAAIYHAGGLQRLARNLAIKSTAAELFLGRLAWIYSFDPVLSE